ncbi:hypothetical protein HYV87_05150 [Candidatus Woesearchaeota archaeon]|nr:hypothetical protein [Candidatus Woesearchaeota archaeon]
MAVEIFSKDPAFADDPGYRSKLIKELEWKTADDRLKFKEEMAEIISGEYQTTGFPQSLKYCRLLWEVFDLGLEEPYFWILDYFKDAFPIIEKVEDSFAAAENSAFFGVTQQRLGAQQDKVSQFLATTGKMIKELFQMVRELRIIDERLIYYNGVAAVLSKPINERGEGKAHDITLKGIFVDLVQGGGKSAASVYGMARELEFVTLPDLFFDAPPLRDEKDLKKHIEALAANFNKNVLRVLERHLNQYIVWRGSTHKEHKNRRDFQLRYLKQHFDIIKMYLAWVKPYLRHVRSLSMKGKNMSSAEMVSAFEGSMLDVEFLARRQIKFKDTKAEDEEEEDKYAHSCVLVTFNYRTRAELKVHQEGYQRGPIHVGKMIVTFRAYAWTGEQLRNYKKLKEKEMLDLFGDVSSSVQAAMESLGTELYHYLEEAEGLALKEKKEEKKEEPPKKSLTEKMFGDFYTSKRKKGPKVSKSKVKHEKAELEDALKKAKNPAQFHAFNAYHLFKKSHRMVAW